MKKRLIEAWSRVEAGQTMVEYSIVAALIAVVAMVSVEALGVGIAGVFDGILESITDV
jgi:Flp pilus assembly pilin Flp